MTRTEIINLLIEKFNYKTYLEIGVQHGINFRSINCISRTGVDPDPQSAAINKETSDSFFLKQDKTTKWDIIFIDGLHEGNQVTKDIINSIKHLSPNGTIVLHDCNPTSHEMQEVPRIAKEWTGDVWKALVFFRTKLNYETFVINTDYGIGIIRPSKPGTGIINIREDYSYQNLEKNRVKWLNLKSVSWFMEWINRE